MVEIDFTILGTASLKDYVERCKLFTLFGPYYDSAVGELERRGEL